MVPENEYNPYFKSFIEDLARNGKTIVENLEETGKFLEQVVAMTPPEKELYAYAEGKWTLKELLVHIIDTERIFNYRALRFSRNDATNVVGFEQDDYNDNSNANERELQDIFEEFKNAAVALPEVQECYLVSGNFDYLIKARVADMSSYREFLGETLLTLPGVQESTSYVVMEQVKETLNITVPYK